MRTAFFYTDPVAAWKRTAEGNPICNSDHYKEHENRLQMDFVFKFLHLKIKNSAVMEKEPKAIVPNRNEM
jgi:hypothetical protein